MIAAPYVEAIGRMERRFLTTAVVPTVVFLTAYTAVLVQSVWSFPEAGAWLAARTVVEQLGLTAVVSAAVWFIAGLLSANWRKIVRLYEGYPLKRWLARGRRAKWDRYRLPGFAFHLAEKERARERNSNVVYRRYAPDSESDTLPTTIGNILLSGERYGVSRYGFETNVLWTRFAWCLPENVQESLERFKEEHQLPLALSFTAASFGVLSGVTIVLAGGSPALFLTSTLIGLGMAVAAYLLAIERTEEYAEQMRAAIDLHHTRLREVWTGTIPDADMKEWFEDARIFFERGLPSLQARREKRARAGGPPSPSPSSTAVAASTSMKQPSAPSSRPSSATSTAKARSGRRTRLVGAANVVAEAIFARIRTLWIVCLTLMAPIGAGFAYLTYRTEVVLVVSAAASPGSPVAYTTAHQRASDALKDAQEADGQSLIATRDLQVGTVLTSNNSATATDFATFALPVQPSLEAGAVVIADVLVRPCGVLMSDVIVADEPTTKIADGRVWLREAQMQTLAGCSPSSVSLLVHPAGG